MITFRMKSLFFDRKLVLDRIGAGAAKTLSKIGGTIRKTAQRSMRYRKKPSAKGTPPSAHKDNPRGPLLRDKLWFAYEPERMSVVIGPVSLGQARGATGPTVPEVQEFGGTVRRLTRVKPKAGRRASPAQAAAFKRKLKAGQIKTKPAQKIYRTVTLSPRPFMGPALAKNKGGLSGVWQNTIRAA